MTRKFALTAILTLIAAPALADHANPWATDQDTVLSRNHETNQLKSVDTPGEDEMRGVMVRKARGKLEDMGTSKRGAGKASGTRAHGRK